MSELYHPKSRQNCKCLSAIPTPIPVSIRSSVQPPFPTPTCSDLRVGGQALAMVWPVIAVGVGAAAYGARGAYATNDEWDIDDKCSRSNAESRSF